MEDALKQKMKIYVEGLEEQINLMIDNKISDMGLKNELQKAVTDLRIDTWRNLESLIDEEG